MEIITIPLSGALKHEDTMGNSAVITVGEVQVMSAGTGVEHAEYNASQTEALSLLQIWILTAKQNAAPRYDQQRFDSAEYHNVFRQVVGPMDGEEGLGIHQDARVALGRFSAGQKVVYPILSPDHGVYFFVIKGAAIVAGKKVNTRDTLGVWEGESVDLLIEQEAFLLAIDVPMKSVLY